MSEVEVKNQLEQIRLAWKNKKCPECKKKLSKMTQSHDPAVISIGYGRLSHPYDLWCCNRHGIAFCDDHVIGLTCRVDAYQCPVCRLLIYPSDVRETDEKRIRKHLKEKHGITGEITVFVNDILWHNGTKTIKLKELT